MNKNDVRVFPKLSQEQMNEYYTFNDRDLNRCTPKQRSYIRGLLDKARMDEYELLCSLGVDCETIKELTIENAGAAINYLKEQLGWK